MRLSQSFTAALLLLAGCTFALALNPHSTLADDPPKPAAQNAANLYIVLSPFHEAQAALVEDKFALTFKSLMPQAGWTIACDSATGPEQTGAIEVKMTVAAPPADAAEVPTPITVSASVSGVDLGLACPLRIWWRSGSSDYKLRALYTFQSDAQGARLSTYTPNWGRYRSPEGLQVVRRDGAGGKFDLTATIIAPQGGYTLKLDKYEPPTDKSRARILTTLKQGGVAGICTPVPVSVKCPVGVAKTGTFELELLTRRDDNDSGYGVRGVFLLSSEKPEIAPGVVTQNKRDEKPAAPQPRDIDEGTSAAARDFAVVRCDFDVAAVYKMPDSHVFVFDGRKMLPAGTKVSADPVEGPDAAGRLRLFLNATPPDKPQAGKKEQMRVTAPLRSLEAGTYCLEVFWRDGEAAFARVGAFHLRAAGEPDPNQRGCVGGVPKPAESVNLRDYTRRGSSEWRSAGVAKYTGKGCGSFDLELTLDASNSDFDFTVSSIEVLEDLAVIRVYLTEKQIAGKKPLRDPYRQVVAKVRSMRASDYIVQVFTNLDYENYKTEYELELQAGIRGLVEKKDD